MRDEDNAAVTELGAASELTQGTFFPTRIEGLVVKDYWDPPAR